MAQSARGALRWRVNRPAPYDLGVVHFVGVKPMYEPRRRAAPRPERVHAGRRQPAWVANSSKKSGS